MKLLLSAIPTYSTPPSLEASNQTAIAAMVREGIQVGREIVSDPSLSESLLASWMLRIQSETNLIEKWVELTLYSLTKQIQYFYSKRGLLSEEEFQAEWSIAEWKEWVFKKIRVLGNLCLIEHSVIYIF